MEKKIGRFIVIGRMWKNHNKSRIYFTVSRSGGQACWDNQEGYFIKVKNRVGVQFEQEIKKAFGL